MNIDIKIDHLLGPNLTTYDPYDLWKTRFGLWLKKLYYSKGCIAIPLVTPFYILDAYTPKLVRKFIQPQEYPTVRALAAMASVNFYEMTGNRKYIELAAVSIKWLIGQQSKGYHGACWGLNMPWMTKMGYFPSTTPFITHTPYCVEALLRYFDITGDNQALNVALSSLEFLENDMKVLLDCPDEMALSYGPYSDGRIVINANAYAMMMYALLADRLPEKRIGLLQKAARIFNFIKSQQNKDGSWFYYTDEKKGNFIDCFHSCFVLKNLIKYGKTAKVDVTSTVSYGLEYILEQLVDKKYFLARKFSISANPSLTKYDLYDQAELLNVLCLTGRMDLAKKIHNSMIRFFYIPQKKSFGYQIDYFGKLNKMTYLRWAVMPTVYALSEYYKLLSNEKNNSCIWQGNISSCVE